MSDPVSEQQVGEMAAQPLSPTINIVSNRGMIVLYDPILLRERVKAPSSWWKEQGPLGTAERNDGRLAVWPLTSGKASSRGYRVRLASALNPETEEPLQVGVSDPTPFVVEGPEVFLGPVERLPGDGSGDRLPSLPDEGQLLNLEPGRYQVTVHVLDWQREDRFFNEDNEPLPDAPPDFVLRLERVEGALCEAPPEVPPLLDYIPKKTPTASKTVKYATRPRTPPEEPKARRRRSGASTGGRRTKKGPLKVKELRPGELGVGATVRHPSFGVGTVLFVKDGFPKARVNFQNTEHKVDKAELTVLS